jgi:membrane fusion protein (multidrug efflux system)
MAVLKPRRHTAARLGVALALLIALAAPVPAQTQGPPAQGPPPSVTIAPAQSKEINTTNQFLGRIDAIQSVALQARVQGALLQVAFHEGQDVHTGDLLYVIEPDQYEAALEAAQAQLASAQATLTQAERELARDQELARRGNISQSALDQARAQRDTAAANVQAAEANVKTAQLNLNYTRITAPIDGRIGATSVTVGNLVGPTSGVLARIVQLDPIRVIFSVSERDILAVEEQHPGASHEELYAQFVPNLVLSDGTTYPETGQVDFVDNTVDPATGTIAVHASFANPQRILLPGMLVTVMIRPARPERRIVVPLDAVQTDQQGRYVLVVDNNNRVVQRRVQVDGQFEQQWIVTAGLQEGENVVVSGVQKVRPGQQVQPVPAGTSPSP